MFQRLRNRTDSFRAAVSMFAPVTPPMVWFLFINIRLLLWKVQFVVFAHAKREYTPPKSGKYSFILFQKEPLWIHLTAISIAKKGRAAPLQHVVV